MSTRDVISHSCDLVLRNHDFSFETLMLKHWAMILIYFVKMMRNSWELLYCLHSVYFCLCFRWKQRISTESTSVQTAFTSEFPEWVTGSVNLMINKVQDGVSLFPVSYQDSRSRLRLWLKLGPSVQLLHLRSCLFRGGDRLSDRSSQGVYFRRGKFSWKGN